jgi:hydrogenase/urease accessory protein HupE
MRGRLAALGLLLAAPLASAHELRPAYLDLRELEPGRYAVLWKLPRQGGVRLAMQPVFPQECVFQPGGELRAPDAVSSYGTLACPGGLGGRTLAVDGLETMLTDALVRVRHADGRSETHLLKAGSPAVALGGAATPLRRWAAYAWLGVEHILLGADHLLFVLGLMLIVKSRLMLVKTVTAFTLAHSVTLAAATLGYARAPVPPVEAAIALSILFLGPEIVRVWRGQTSFTIRHPWVVALAFGLLHGFGFASGLRAMGLPSAEIPLALLLFNVGVEAGQLAFVLLVFALERASATLRIRWPRFVTRLPGYAVGSLGAFWTIERTVALIASLG